MKFAGLAEYLATQVSAKVERDSGKDDETGELHMALSAPSNEFISDRHFSPPLGRLVTFFSTITQLKRVGCRGVGPDKTPKRFHGSPLRNKVPRADSSQRWSRR